MVEPYICILFYVTYLNIITYVTCLNNVTHVTVEEEELSSVVTSEQEFVFKEYVVK